MNKFVVSVLSFTAGAVVMAMGVGYTNASRRVKKDKIRSLCNEAAAAPIKECKQAMDALHTEASDFICTYYSEQIAARHRMYNLGIAIDELQNKIKQLGINPEETQPSIDELEAQRMSIIDEIENIILDQ